MSLEIKSKGRAIEIAGIERHNTECRATRVYSRVLIGGDIKMGKRGPKPTPKALAFPSNHHHTEAK